MTNTYRVTLTIDLEGDDAEDATGTFVHCVTRGQFQGEMLTVQETRDWGDYVRISEIVTRIDPVNLL